MKPRRLHSATIFSIVTASASVEAPSVISRARARSSAADASPALPPRGRSMRASARAGGAGAWAGRWFERAGRVVRAREPARGAASLRMAAVARILILAGGCRGRRLAAQLVGEGHAVRVSTRTEAARGDRGDGRGVLGGHARPARDAARSARRRRARVLAAGLVRRNRAAAARA